MFTLYIFIYVLFFILTGFIQTPGHLGEIGLPPHIVAVGIPFSHVLMLPGVFS